MNKLSGIRNLMKSIQSSREKEKQQRYDLVAACSPKYRQLLELLAGSPVSAIPELFSTELVFASRKSMENAEEKDVIVLAANSCGELKELYANLLVNRENRQAFLQAAAQIADTPEEVMASSGLTVKKFRETEDGMIREIIDSIREDCIVEIRLRYCTPKGECLAERAVQTDYRGLKEAYSSQNRREAARLAEEYERSRLTASLRYDVMIRDRFRCVLCGTSQEDGAELYVDYIRPVSEGGKTEMDNLRTVCSRCGFDADGRGASAGGREEQDE